MDKRFERLCRLMLDHQSCMTAMLDMDGRVRAANRTVLRMTDLPANKIVGTEFSNLPPWNSQSTARHQIETALHEVRSTGRDQVLVVSTGTAHDDRLIEFDFRQVDCDEIGDQAVIVEGHDVTSARQMESDLRRREARYHSLSKASPTGIFHMDRNGNCTYVNARWCEITGLSYNDAVGGKWFDTIHPEDLPRVQRAIADAIEHNISTIAELRLVHPDGSLRWAIGQSVPERNSSGETVGYVGTLSDITAEKTAEDALQISQTLLRMIVDSGPILHWAVDRNGIITLTEGGGLKTLGFRPGETVGQSIYDLYPGAREQIDRCLGGAETTGLLETEGDFIWHTSCVPMRAADGSVSGVLGVSLDITERVRSEKALRTSEARFRSIVESTPLGMFFYELDADDRLIFKGANPAADRILGVNNSRYVGMTIEEAFPPLAKTEVPDRYRKAARDGVPWETERIDYEDEEISGAFEVHAFQTQPGRVAVIFSDITERKQAELRLSESELRYRTLFEQSSDGVVLLKDGQFVDCNDLMLQIFGCNSREDVIGKTPFDFSPERQPDGQISEEKGLAFIQAAQRGGVQTFDWQHQRLDGDTFDTEIRLGPVDLSDGGYLLALVRDVRERRRAEEALRTSEARLRTIFRVAPIGVMVIRDRAILEVNERVCKMLGRTSEELIGNSTRILYPTDEEFERVGRVVQPQVRDHGTGEVETIWMYCDGRPLDVLLVGSLIDADDPSKGVIVTAMDITERKRAEADRDRLNRQLENSRDRLAIMSRQLMESQEQERRRIARELHDEIGQLLTAMKINLQSLAAANGATTDSEPTRRRFAEQQSLIDTAIEQVRNLALDLRPSVLDDLGLVPAVRWFVSRQLELAGLEGTVEDSGLPERIPAEVENTCYRVLQEAITNILRHARARHIKVALRREGQHLELTVRDDGIGFDVAASRRKSSLGESFGLLGMEERLGLLGGTLVIKSAPSAGTEVIASLPLKLEEKV